MMRTLKWRIGRPRVARINNETPNETFSSERNDKDSAPKKLRFMLGQTDRRVYRLMNIIACLRVGI